MATRDSNRVGSTACSKTIGDDGYVLVNGAGFSHPAEGEFGMDYGTSLDLVILSCPAALPVCHCGGAAADVRETSKLARQSDANMYERRCVESGKV